MKVSRRWLEDFLRRPLDVTDVARRLASLGAPADAIEPVHPGLEEIVVALVEDLRQHPNADRLRVCTVFDGSETRKNVVCGASNVTAGRKYPFAPVGASVPVSKAGGPMRIERAKLRGEVSEGMLCSARELGVGQDHEGIWELSTEAAPGTKLLDALPLADERIVLDISPNRPDLLGHKGVARELAASLQAPFRLPALPGTSVDVPRFNTVSGARQGSTGGVRIAIDDLAGCARFHAAVIRGIRIGPSPEWLRRPLEAVGVRSINNVVDATNYVMLELGQPLHAYDLATLRGPALIARDAQPGETVVTLDGVSRKLVPGMTVIADADRVIGVGGVMGGSETEVRDSTTDLVLECAWFTPSRLRATRRALGLSTEASHRFERGVDRWNAAEATRRCIEIVIATAGGTLIDVPLDVHPEPAHPPRVFLRLARVSQVLGVELDLHEVERCLVAIGATVVAKPEDGRLAVDVPGWRPDLQEEIDLVEEVGRVHGYDNLPDGLRPFRVGDLGDAVESRSSERVRRVLVEQGLFEVVTLPFGPPDPTGSSTVQLLNPVADTGAHLRRRLLPSLVRATEQNWNVHQRDVRLFEIGTVFEPAVAGARPVERLAAALVVSGAREPAHWSVDQHPDVDRWDVKGLAQVLAALAYPGITWHVEGESWVARGASGQPVGWAGPLEGDAPPWAAPLFGAELEVMTADRPVLALKPLPVTPASTRDLSLVLPDGVPAARVETLLRAAAGALLEDVQVVSEFRGAAVGEAHRSVSFRLVFRAPDRTLRDEEVDTAERKVLEALSRALGIARR